VSHKSKSSKRGAIHGCTEISHTVSSIIKVRSSHELNCAQMSPPVQDQTTRLRAFNHEEYPAISSNTPTTEPGDILANSVPPTTESLPSVENLSWEENLRILPLEEAEALRVLSREAQYSISPSAPRDAGNGCSSMTSTCGKHHQGDKPMVIVEESSVKEVDLASEPHSTGLEWAAAELTSPMKFSSRWRHSSLPHRSITPSQDGFDDSIEISTTRNRSNSTTIHDPRVRAVQFGDFPIPLNESVEGDSSAPSSYPSNPSHGVSNEISTHYESMFTLNSVPVTTASLSASAEVLTGLAIPVTSQIPFSHPHDTPAMPMPQLYQPQGYFVAAPGYHPGHQTPHFVPYSPHIPSFAHAVARPVLSSTSSHISNHAHPIHLTHEYPPSKHNSPSVTSHDHQQNEQASQQEGNNNKSVTGPSRSNVSLETQSNINQQTAGSNSPKGSPEHAGYRCSCCFQGAIPSAHKPLYFCPGCGPMCAIRYCSAACLLAHSYQHSSSCMRMYSMYFMFLWISLDFSFIV